jgi:hypothetical protein
MYVVKGDPREGGGAIVVTRRARVDALAAAIGFLDLGCRASRSLAIAAPIRLGNLP